MSSPDEFSIINTEELAALRATVEELKSRSPESLTDPWAARAKKAEAGRNADASTIANYRDQIADLIERTRLQEADLVRLRKQITQQKIDQMDPEDAKLLGLTQVGTPPTGYQVGEIYRLRKENERLRTELTRGRTNFNDMQAQYGKVRQEKSDEIRDLLGRNDWQKGKIQEMDADLTDLRERLASMTTKRDFDYNQCVSLTVQLEAAERQISRLQYELTQGTVCRHGIVMKMQPDGSYNIKINNGPESFTVKS